MSVEEVAIDRKDINSIIIGTIHFKLQYFQTTKLVELEGIKEASLLVAFQYCYCKELCYFDIVSLEDFIKAVFKP